MKGISSTIAVIIFLMIVIALGSLSYMFFTDIIQSVSKRGEEAIKMAQTSGQALMKIESFSGNKIYIRNIGQVNLSDIKVYIGDTPVSVSVSPLPVPPGGVATITITGSAPSGDIKITTAEGALSIQGNYPGYSGVDVIPPVISFNSPSAGSWQRINFQVNYDANDETAISICNYSTRDGTSGSWTYRGTTNCLSNQNTPAITVGSAAQCSVQGSNQCGVRIAANDTSGNSNNADRNFSIDYTIPQYSFNSTNSTEIGTPVRFSLRWSDNTGLSRARTSLWNGSSWVNATGWCTLSANPAWCNQTLRVNSTPQQLWWKQYANDTSSNWATSENFSLITTDTTPPSIAFIPLTPSNGATLTQNFVYLNTSITDLSDTSAFFDWNYSLVGYWAMDYYNSTGIFDNSTYNNFGTFRGGLETGNITTGQYGNGLRFDGLDDYLSIVDNNALNVRNTTTFEAWIYPVGWGEGSTGRIFDKNQTTAYAFLITNTSSNIQQIRVYFGNSVYYSDNYTISLNSWQHVVVTFDVSLSSEQVKIYVNGIQRGVGTRTSTIPVNSESLYIGNRAGLDRTFNGIIDEVRIYNRALSQEEINASYNNGLYRLHNKFTNLPTGTYSYYAYAIDAFGNLGKSETRTVTLNYLYGCNVNPGRILSDPTWNSNEYRDLSANKLSCDAIRIWPWNGWKYSDLESIGSWAASKDIKIEPVLVTDIATFNISGFPDDLTTSKANFTTFVNNLKTNARSFYDQIYAWDVNNEPNLGNTNELNWVKNMLNYVYSENNSHLVTVGIGKQRTMKHDLQLIAAYENISSVHFYYPAIDRGADCSACTPLSKVCNSTCACYFTLSMFPVDVNLTWFINDIVKTDLITAGVPNQQIDIQEFGTPICPKDGYGCTDIATQGQWFNTFFTTIQDLKDAGDTQIRNLFFWQLKGACGIPFGVINDTDFSLYPAGSVIADFYR